MDSFNLWQKRRSARLGIVFARHRSSFYFKGGGYSRSELQPGVLRAVRQMCMKCRREFNHRVKSVSMAKFSAEEVTALQAGGNEKAKQKYFKDWDPHRHSYPDTNNIPRLRDFIKSVYVDRRFTGERTQDNLPRVRLNDKEDSYNIRKLSFSRSERYEDRNDMRSPSSRNEDRSFKYYYEDRRSPIASRNGNHRRNPVKIEVVDDRFRDNESRSRRFSSTESKETAVSPEVQKHVDRGKKGAPAGGEGSVKENPAEQENPETQTLTVVTSRVSDSATAPEAQSTSQSNDGSDWAPFETSLAKEASQTPNTHTSKCSTTETATKPLDAIEFLVSELSGPLYATASSLSDVRTADNDTPTARVEDISVDVDLAPPTSAGQITPLPNNIGVCSVTSTSDSDLTQPSIAGSSATQPMSPSVRDVPSLNQPEVDPKAQDLSNSLMELSLEPASKPAQGTRSDVRSHPRITQTKSIGRKELPANLFTTSYLPGPAPQAGWQNFQPHCMGYGLQYYSNAAPVSAFPTATKSTNPFDATEGRPRVLASAFPTMANLRGAQTAMPTGAGLVRASSVGALGSMVPQSPNYASSVPPQSPFTPGFPSGAYFEQVNNNMQTARPRRAGSFNGETAFQHSTGGYMAPGYSLNSFPKTGGNPFG
ncbi:probable ADP-ribosylation factor GTPase-activating protein AGD14 [Neltuma alba]|uniref:probable ADP-ribosylation factor GTPase-activating protein AGD14 n=1 Tax=Neltuma alba TaxID=207710 RepID=UPI0010A477CB|nr:probable ADP-ribosylation factor GTPase-activating protein AGD14 [Prosopis alba]